MLLAENATGVEGLTDAIGVFNDDYFWLWLIIPLLAIVSLYITIRTRGVQFRMIPEMFRVLRSKPEIAPDGKRAVSSLQAFMISAAARIGTGNIIGVSIAISLGGPGAVFWMWVMAVVVCGASFVESTLAQLYKVRHPAGYRGGPAYYIEKGLGQRWLAVIFAVILIITFPLVFNAVQSNTISGAIANSADHVGVDADTTLFAGAIGVLLVVITGLVIFGGVRRIAHTAQALIPFFAGLYVVIGLLLMVMNWREVPGMFATIIEHAFGIQEFTGAALGVVIIQGVRRGMFSNEAGLGSAPNAAASASVTHPAKQGLVQTLGVYLDTLVICSITAFIILLGRQELSGEMEGDLTQFALTAQLGPWALHLMTLIIFLVAFTSVLGNYYYGESNIEYLSSSARVLFVYKCVFLVATFLGALGEIALIWTLADTTMGMMALVNLIAIAPLTVIACRLLDDYMAQRRQGLDPVFTRDRLPDVTGVECWEPRERDEEKATS